MKFYSQQDELYCGIDLHANSMYACVVDHSGNKRLHRNFNTKKPERFLDALKPFRQSESDRRRWINLQLVLARIF